LNELSNNKELSPEQLAALDLLAGSQRVSEDKFRQVTQRKEASIYVTINRLHNLLFVRTSDKRALEEIARVIKTSDRPIPQVLLEMKVLEVQLTDANVSAFDLSYIAGDQTSGPDDGHVPNPLNTTASTVGSALLGLGNFSVQAGNTFVFQLLNDHIRARLQALEQDDNVKTLATPMLLSSNNKPARIFIGEQLVLTTGYKNTGSVSGSNNTVYTTPTPVTDVVDVGNTLTILPSINADRSVVMRLIHENSSPSVGGGRITVVAGGKTHEVPIDTVDKSTMEGTVLAKDGYTVAVGGMMRTSQTDNESKVPLLGDIPLLGSAFKQTKKSTSKTELVLLITPHVLSPGAESEKVSKKRLKSLMSQPSDVDVLLSQRTRHHEELAGAGESEQERQYAQLMRFASSQVRLPASRRKSPGEMVPVRLKGGRAPAIFKNADLYTRPIASWSRNGLFVTALELRNASTKSVRLEQESIRGDWLAVALERSSLPARGQSYLYLISGSPFGGSHVH
jgi:general secretion pathway protein D